MTTPNKQIGKYKVERKLGEGGMGDVYLGFDTESEKLVAIKTIRRELVDNPKKLQRFQREIDLQRKVVHPNVVQILDMGEHEGTQYIVLEYVEGQELGDVVPAGGWDISKSAHVTERVCLAMHDVHELGIIHRDMKPANVLLDTVGNPHIIDFGVAKSLSTEEDVKLTRDGAFVGTLEYASPEQAEGRLSEVDRRSDIFNLGAMLYKLVTGRTPFYDPKRTDPNDMRMRIVRDHPIEPRRIRPEIPADLEKIILRALAKAREQRYQTTQEMAEDLAKFRAGERVRMAYSLKADKLSQWFAKHRLKIFAATAFLGATCGFSYYYAGKLAQEKQRMYDRADELVSEHEATRKEQPVQAAIAAQRVLLNVNHKRASELLAAVTPSPEDVVKTELDKARDASDSGDATLASEHIARAYAMSPRAVNEAGHHFFDGRWLDTAQARAIGVLSPQNERNPGMFFFGKWVDEKTAISLGHLLYDAKRDQYLRGDDARLQGWHHENGEWLEPAKAVSLGLSYFDAGENRYYSPGEARARGFTFQDGRWLTAEESEKLGRGMKLDGKWLIENEAQRAGYRHDGERWYHVSDAWLRLTAGWKLTAPEPVTAIGWGQRDKYYVVGTVGGKIVLFEKQAPQSPVAQVMHVENGAGRGQSIVELLVFDRTDSLLLARDSVGLIALYEVAGGRLIRRRELSRSDVHDMFVVSNEPPTFDLAFRASGLLRIERTPLDTQANRMLDVGTAYAEKSSAWSHDGRDMLLVHSGKVWHWDMVQSKQVRSLPLPFEADVSVLVSFVPNAVIAVANQNEVKLMDGRDGRILGSRQMPGAITALTFDVTGESLVIAYRSPKESAPDTVRGTKLQAGGVK